MGRKRGPRPANVAANGATEIREQMKVVSKFIASQPSGTVGRSTAMGAAMAVDMVALDIYTANAPQDARGGKKEKVAPADTGKI